MPTFPLPSSFTLKPKTQTIQKLSLVCSPLTNSDDSLPNVFPPRTASFHHRCRRVPSSNEEVSILKGTVMGNGAGVSIHGKFRVVTEKTLFVMPETTIGAFPDVGASYFLSRIPGYFGEYVGLTGARLNGSEMLACGLATHFVSSEKLDLLEDSLVGANTSDSLNVSEIINKFSEKMPLGKSSAYNRNKRLNNVLITG